MGCSACVSACPVDALELKQDECGFYRSAINDSKCIGCGKCTRICPALNLRDVDNVRSLKCFEYVSSDPEVLRRSSSGGVFTALARAAFAQGGAVVGAVWTDDFVVRHIIIESESELDKLRKSKYVQSYVGNLYRDVKEMLGEGRLVLFTGTPCQVAGLYAYLGRDYENLLTVDMLCGNAPSQGFLNKYIDDSFGGRAAQYEFRHKSDTLGWSCSHVAVTMKNGHVAVQSGEKQDDFQRVYHNHAMCAPHCEKCKFQSLPRLGDLTIGDFWWIESHDPFIRTSDGVSLVLCNNKKGSECFATIPEGAYRVKKEVPLEWMGGNGHSLVGGKNRASPHRDEFFSAIQRMPFRQAVDYALKPNHGKARVAYDSSNAMVQLDSAQSHFRFEPHVWEEYEREGKLTLSVKHDMWSPGHFACLPLAKRSLPISNINCAFVWPSSLDLTFSTSM